VVPPEPITGTYHSHNARVGEDADCATVSRGACQSILLKVGSARELADRLLDYV
jgi:hypothetical protein